MIEIDELDLLRRPREVTVWRDQPVRSWKLTLWSVFFYLIAVAILWFFFKEDLQFVDWYLVILFIIILYCGGGSSEAETLVTQDRILRKGRQRGFWGNRSDPPYSVPLNEVAEVSLADSGPELLVEIQRTESQRVDVLRANQPQALAAAIAEGAGITAPPQVGRLEYLYRVCAVIVSVPVYVSIPWAVDALQDRFVSEVHFYGAAVPALVVYVVLLLLATSLVGFVAVLFMPRIASAAEAANWLRLTPQKRRFRWTGWKSRPYHWLAGLTYGADLEVRA